jgi:hypothetical protein
MSHAFNQSGHPFGQCKHFNQVEPFEKLGFVVVILTSPYSSFNHVVHSYVIWVFFSFDFIMCPIFVSVSCPYDCLLPYVCDIGFVFSFDCTLIPICNICDVVVLGFEFVEGTYPKFLIKDLVLKSHILDLDEKEVENVNKGGWRASK